MSEECYQNDKKSASALRGSLFRSLGQRKPRGSPHRLPPSLPGGETDCQNSIEFCQHWWLNVEKMSAFQLCWSVRICVRHFFSEMQLVLLPPSGKTCRSSIKGTPSCRVQSGLIWVWSVFQVFRALGGVNGEKRRGGLHLARPKSPNMQELKRRFRQVLSSKVKSATTLWMQDGTSHSHGRVTTEGWP